MQNYKYIFIYFFGGSEIRPMALDFGINYPINVQKKYIDKAWLWWYYTRIALQFLHCKKIMKGGGIQCITYSQDHIFRSLSAQNKYPKGYLHEYTPLGLRKPDAVQKICTLIGNGDFFL